jgi:translation initiation factor IF-2
MSETKNTGEKTLSVPGKTLSLKRSSVEQGMVRQSFSHGRSKAVVVEKVKRRPGPGDDHAVRPRPAAFGCARPRGGSAASRRPTRGERCRPPHADG